MSSAAILLGSPRVKMHGYTSVGSNTAILIFVLFLKRGKVLKEYIHSPSLPF